MRRDWRSFLYIITILFFALGFINILFAWLGIICFTLPFILLIKNKRKTWCQGYCPRVSLFETLFRNRVFKGRSAPSWLIKGDGKWLVFAYFLFNLFVLTMSTIMVFKGRIFPVESIRFLIAFRLPWDVPQLLYFGAAPDWAVHLSYRIYSMMLTTTILGLLLSWVYKPRTWCAVCPINTASDLMLNKNMK